MLPVRKNDFRMKGGDIQMGYEAPHGKMEVHHEERGEKEEGNVILPTGYNMLTRKETQQGDEKLGGLSPAALLRSRTTRLWSFESVNHLRVPLGPLRMFEDYDLRMP